MRPTILAIESSCDETSAAVISNGKVLNNIVASQNEHHKYGGVVPELASRAHQRQIVGVVEEAMHLANIVNENLDAVAFTRGPGLMGSLLVGVSFAKAAAAALDRPIVAVHHLAGHIESIWLEHGDIPLPAVVLVVCLWLGARLKNYFQKTYSVLTGGR